MEKEVHANKGHYFYCMSQRPIKGRGERLLYKVETLPNFEESSELQIKSV